MKRWGTLLAFILMMVTKTIYAGETPDVYTSGDYEYIILEDGSAEIKRYKGEDEEVIVPEELDGHSVISLGSDAFVSPWADIKTIRLPNSLVVLNCNSFLRCNARIVLSPDHPTLAVIDDVLFDKTDKRLIRCRDREGEYVIPEGIKKIGELGFGNCGNVTNIVIPETVTTIGYDAFFSCKNIEHFEIPDSISEFEGYTFSKCEALKELKIPDGIESIPEGMFFMCSSLETLDIPDSVTSIGRDAFECCGQLSSITIPAGVVEIGDRAFHMCGSLKEITIPESVAGIGQNAFQDCNDLIITVSRDSYAANYCETNGLNYTYSDANDWLNE